MPSPASEGEGGAGDGGISLSVKGLPLRNTAAFALSLHWLARLLLAIELSLLVVVVVMQLFANWDDWLAYSNQGILILHIVNASLSVWHGALPRETVPSESGQNGLWLFRTFVVIIDTMVLARAGRAVHNDASSTNVAQMVIIAALLAVSFIRWVALSRIITDRARTRAYVPLDTTETLPLMGINSERPPLVVSGGSHLGSRAPQQTLNFL